MKYSICLVLLLTFTKAIAQIKIGVTDNINSKILNETRKLLVYTPEHASSNPEQKYPVIYLLDGETYFHSYTGVVSHLSEVNGNSIIPEMIVVAIVNTDRTRDLSPSRDTTSQLQPNGGGETFMLFIEKELIPYIESHYPTAPYRMFVGHSLGGLLVANALLRHSNLFNSYICLDPSFDWHQQKLLKESGNIFSTSTFDNKKFFLGGSSLCLKSNREFENMLTSTNPNGLRWTSKYYTEDSHGSVPLIGFYDGLRWTFDFYKRPSFVKITDSTGTVIEEHYEMLSTKMGYKVSPPENLLLGLAWRCRVLEKNYEIAQRLLDVADHFYPNSVDVSEAFLALYTDKGDTQLAKQYADKVARLRKNP